MCFREKERERKALSRERVSVEKVRREKRENGRRGLKPRAVPVSAHETLSLSLSIHIHFCTDADKMCIHVRTCVGSLAERKSYSKRPTMMVYDDGRRREEASLTRETLNERRREKKRSFRSLSCVFFSLRSLSTLLAGGCPSSVASRLFHSHYAVRFSFPWEACALNRMVIIMSTIFMNQSSKRSCVCMCEFVWERRANHVEPNKRGPKRSFA